MKVTPLTVFDSQNFHTLPTPEALGEALGRRGVRPARMRLFRFSSCSPTFCIDLAEPMAGRRRIVLRGRPQNLFEGVSHELPRLDSEIRFYRLAAASGVRVPAILWDGAVDSVAAADRRTGTAATFDFYGMGYAQGAAIDRCIVAADNARRLRLIDEVARIFAALHRNVGSSFGLLAPDGGALESLPDMAALMGRSLARKAATARQVGSTELAGRVDEVLKGLPALYADAAASGWAPPPSLVLYDSVGGNMLCHGSRISIVDVSTAAWLDPVTELCALVFSLGPLVLEEVDGLTLLEHFFRRYRAWGGSLPEDPAMLRRLLAFYMFNDVLSAHLYFSQHRNEQKRAKAARLAGMAARLHGLLRSPPGWAGLVGAVAAAAA